MSGALRLPARLPRGLALLALSVFYVLAGANHFVNPTFYLRMMPDYLPLHAELVYLSGVLEILGGLGALAPATRALAGWGLVALLIAVFPANVDMALHPDRFPEFGAAALYARLPVQGLLIAWAWWATRPDARPANGEDAGA